MCNNNSDHVLNPYYVWGELCRVKFVTGKKLMEKSNLSDKI